MCYYKIEINNFFRRIALNKKTVFYNLWWLLAFPALIACLFTALYGFMTLNYEYLPAEIDFLSRIFDDLSYITLDVALCFCLGSFCYACHKRKALPALISFLVSFVGLGTVPMLMFFVRSVFVASISDSQTMSEYFSRDVYTSLSGVIRTVAGMLLVLAVTAVFFFGKMEKPFAKPYLAPKSEPSLMAFVMTAANLLFITFSFTFGEDYDFVSLAFQVVFAVASYFVMIFGVYMAQKKCVFCTTERENSTKSIDKKRG